MTKAAVSAKEKRSRDMPVSRSLTRNGPTHGELLAAVGIVGLALTGLTVSRSRFPRRQRQQADKRAAFAAYVRDHIAGADAAIGVVERLRVTHQGTAEGPLFASLHQQFREDRGAAEALLKSVGAAPMSLKRVATRATGGMLKTAAGGSRGSLALFRTLEALAIGVQGKRCMWRAAQRLSPAIAAPGRRTFLELESDAVKQWEAIERHRSELVPRTFGV
jgi:hypothetical protein